MPGWVIRVQGRVQGVGFRAFVQRTAKRYAVRGEVWNRTDSSVEMTVWHENEVVLGGFKNALWSGPGRVDGVFSRETAGVFPEDEGMQIGESRVE